MTLSEEGQTLQKDEKTDNNLQNTIQSTKDRVTRIPMKTGNELKFT
jgi:hypothetical protein